MSIKEFLEAKKTDDFKNDEDRWKDYLIQYVDDRGLVVNGYINDAVETIEGNRHTVDVLILNEDDTMVRIRKSCVAPDGCNVDWDLVHCAYVLL